MTEHKPWLSLPDEDPPERGLAELMAAARAKAEIMASPPWWKRLGELLRRPPVLALATVVVLIGGVIIVHHAPAEMSAPAMSPPASGEVAPVEPAAFGAAQSLPPAPVVEKKLVGTHGTATESRTGTSKLARPDNARIETGTVQVEQVRKAQEQAPIVDDTMQRDRGAAVKQAIAADTAVEQPPASHTAQKAPIAKKPGESLARCRAAATNKDCAGLRACAKQLELDDPQFYKANGATIKSCL